jgi:hypothetical protein
VDGAVARALEIEVPHVKEAAATFVSRLFPRGVKLLRSEPLRAMVIRAFVRGLSMRDVESLCEKAGMGKLLLKSTGSKICQQLRERVEQFKRATSTTSAWSRCSWTPPSWRCGPTAQGRRADRLGFTKKGERLLLSVMLGMCESYEEWLALGRSVGVVRPPGSHDHQRAGRLSRGEFPAAKGRNGGKRDSLVLVLEGSSLVRSKSINARVASAAGPSGSRACSCARTSTMKSTIGIVVAASRRITAGCRP